MKKFDFTDVIVDTEDPRVRIGGRYYFADTPRGVVSAANKGGEGAILEVTDSMYGFKFEGYDDTVGCVIPVPELDSDPISYTEKPVSIRIRWMEQTVDEDEDEEEYVPFDLDKEDDRRTIMGSVVRDLNDQLFKIVAVRHTHNSPDWRVHLPTKGTISADALFKFYRFADGTPCGKKKVK